ncbi:uncharacterized protein PV06_10335 [Exophiala oligosperma]|uniref:Uncharacterized protein n=1 Tax=Exophiala oligosperma TaxID=215243 RepID=A0A0D2D317_9EURO|nr:uncharacterized protein PV06_10335 [Exophiala oligosperma]KIW37703.1 hypothetical protein PV06_10335 [Exophiala oligosperma]
MDHGQHGVSSVDWQDWIDLEAGSRREESRRLGGSDTKPPPSFSPGSPRRLSLPLTTIPIPENAVLADGGRMLDVQRPRSSSLPWSTISSLDPKLPLPDVRNAIITPSPFAGDSNINALPQVATIVNDQVVEEPSGDINTQRNPSRASIRSLDRYYNSKRVKFRGKKRGKVAQILFQYSIYLLLACIIYFFFVGVPLWKGTVYWLWWAMEYKLVVKGGCAIFIAIAFFYAIGTLFVRYEPDPVPPRPEELPAILEKNSSTALIIACYKSAEIIGRTLEAALQIFPPENIFVVANGNSPTPLDNTEDVCRLYGVNHVWVPVGSKIVAQFVGVYAAHRFQYVLMIDDDCALPPGFPIVSERIQRGDGKGLVKCVGYTIKAVGPDGTKGSLVQQLQDMEYKLSGMARKWMATWGTATFAHGAIALWDRDFILKCFRHHPGFKISEDWYFGLVCRSLGGRILMCSSVLVETEVPSGLFVGAGARGGFGEMTVYKQRFYRWNFFFLYRVWDSLKHILFDWNLGIYSIGDKVYTFQELYCTMLYVIGPILLVLAFMIEPEFTGIMTGIIMGMYFSIAMFFNEVILRKKGEMVSRKVVIFCYMPYKFVLRFMNIVSVYYSALTYAKYFAVRHLSIIEDEQVVELVIHSKPIEPRTVSTSGGERRNSIHNRVATTDWSSEFSFSTDKGSAS